MILSVLQKEKELDYTRVAEVIVSMSGDAAEDKNIRRRIYDALNVMCAVNIIRKEKKIVSLVNNSLCSCEGEIETRLNRLENIVTSASRLKKRIEEKMKILEETERRKELLLELIERNRDSAGSEDKEKLHFPFILISTGKKSRIDCETNDKRSYFKFAFADEYRIHEDVHILKQLFEQGKKMNLLEGAQGEGARSGGEPEEDKENLEDKIKAASVKKNWEELSEDKLGSTSYLLTEDEDWLNLYNFLN